METIEKRALAHAGASTNSHAIYDELYVLATRYASYKEGATEQKAIDIEKALSFLRYYGEGDFSCWREFEAHFRKAMEE